MYTYLIKGKVKLRINEYREKPRWPRCQDLTDAGFKHD